MTCSVDNLGHAAGRCGETQLWTCITTTNLSLWWRKSMLTKIAHAKRVHTTAKRVHTTWTLDTNLSNDYVRWTSISCISQTVIEFRSTIADVWFSDKITTE